MSNYFGTTGADTFTGGTGNDSIQGGTGADTLNGGDGDDVIYGTSPTLIGVTEVDILSGGAGIDWLFGGEGSDSLFGGDGDDHLIRGSGRSDGRTYVLSALSSTPPAGSFDTMHGGGGTDTAYFFFAPTNTATGFVANLSNPTVTTSAFANGIPIAEFNSVERIVLVGGGLDCAVVGGNFADQIGILGGAVSAGGGDDIVTVGAAAGIGDSVLDGGAGTDVLAITATVTANYTFALLATGTSVLTSNGTQLVGATNFESLNILTGAGNDTLTGGAGNDTINGGTGNDVIDGGDGVDVGWLSFEDRSASLVFDNSNSSATNVFLVGGVASGSFTNIENIVVRGGSENDTITGGAGVDIIAGGLGNDILDGGGGTADRASYRLDAGVSVSLEIAGAQNTGGAGIDTLINFEGIVGSANADTLTGNGGANVLSGEGGNDTIYGLGGNDTLYASLTDAVSLGHGAGDLPSSVNTLDGGDGDDTLYGASGIDTLLGGEGADILRGGDSSDALWGGSGNDSLDGGSGNDALNGESGVDEARYFNALSGVTVSLALQGVAQDTVGGGSDTLTGIENLSGSYFDDVLSGDGNANRLMGNEGADSLSGQGGADILDGGVGADALLGGDGDDQIDGGGDADFLGGGTGNDTLLGGTGNDRLIGEDGVDLLQGGEGSDILIGDGPYGASTGWDLVSTGSDVIEGGAGNDVLIGGLGSDILNGGDGDDRLFNGVASTEDLSSFSWLTVPLATGNDVMDGGAGNDRATIVLTDRNSSVVLQINDSSTLATILVGGVSQGSVVNVESIDVFGGSAGDTIDVSGLSSSSTNWLDGGGGNDTLTGGSSFDALFGGEGNDTLRGGLGGDQLDGGAGDDFLDGEGGVDQVSYAVAVAGVTVSLAVQGVVQNTSGAGNDTLVGIENLFGSYLYDDTLTGDANANKLQGAGGADTLAGGGGNDTLWGDEGNDTLDGGSGVDSMVGGSGDDIYVVDDIGDTTGESAAGGTDTVQTSVTFTLSAEIENATVTSAGGVMVTGNAANNAMTGHSGNDQLFGGLGNDLLEGGSGSDVLDGGAGTDTASYGSSFAGVSVSLAAGSASGGHAAGDTLTGMENLLGSSFNDTLTGDAGINVLSGGGGSDTLDGGLGSDTLSGGLGDDVYFVDDVGDVIVEGSGEGTDQVYTGLAQYQLGATSVESVVTTRTNGAYLIGNALANLMLGGVGSDTLDGGVGADFMVGGAGNDFYFIDDISDVIIETAGGGVDQLYSNLAYYALGSADIESVVANLSSGCYVIGNGIANLMVGGVGADTLDGGAGADFLAGGAGNDFYFVDDIGDVVAENADGGTDQVYVGLDYYSLGVTDIESVVITRAAGGYVIGNALANLIVGGVGADTLDGGSGADFLVGGAGNDFYFVDNAGDVVIENAGEGVDQVMSAISYQLGAQDIEALVLTGSGGINGSGNALDNLVAGNGGANALRGNGGADTLVGGGGADRFVYGSAGEGGDAIVDFVSGVDKVQVAAAGFGGGLVAGGAASLVSGAAPSATLGSGQFLYNTSNGQLLWDADGTGGGAAVLLATLSGAPAITASDIEVVSTASPLLLDGGGREELVKLNEDPAPEILVALDGEALIGGWETTRPFDPRLVRELMLTDTDAKLADGSPAILPGAWEEEAGSWLDAADSAGDGEAHAASRTGLAAAFGPHASGPNAPDPLADLAHKGITITPEWTVMGA